MDVIGEIIEASTTEFAAESRELHSPPAFGSFVRVDLPGDAPTPPEEDPFEARRAAAIGRGEAIYAVVHHAATSPVDTSRRPRAYWKDEEQLAAEQPELAEWLLVTEFRAIIIGYSASGSIMQFLPPRPPRIHCQVHPCSADEVRRITERMDFLRTLSGAKSADEVIAACIREGHRAHGGMEFLVAAGKELASIMKDDYDRLQSIMRRVSW
ncbi:MAG: hypothetical protein ACYC2Y_01050 [Armatimonadota bacterium]